MTNAIRRGAKWACLTTALLATGSVASAQSINPALDAQEREVQVTAAFTVPLGTSMDRRETAPRFEIIARNRAPSSDIIVVAQNDDQRWRERRIGVTLDGRYALMMDGQPTQPDSDHAHLNTLETVLVAGGVLLVGFAIFVGASIDNISSNDG